MEIHHRITNDGLLFMSIKSILSVSNSTTHGTSLQKCIGIGHCISSSDRLFLVVNKVH